MRGGGAGEAYRALGVTGRRGKLGDRLDGVGDPARVTNLLENLKTLREQPTGSGEFPLANRDPAEESQRKGDPRLVPQVALDREASILVFARGGQVPLVERDVAEAVQARRFGAQVPQLVLDPDRLLVQGAGREGIPHRVRDDPEPVRRER